MNVKALVFDLDGTLLDTMPDLAVAANAALTEMGYPTFTLDEMLAHMGLGGRELMRRLMPVGATPEQGQRTFERWRELYIGSTYELTRPFAGIPCALHALRARNVKLAVLSNKFDQGVRTLVERHFPGLFDVVRGDRPPTPRKPDPTSLLAVLNELGVRASETAYVGDSIVDVLTAHNAGARCIGVTWGYDAIAPLPASELDAYVSTPDELVILADSPTEISTRATMEKAAGNTTHSLSAATLICAAGEGGEMREAMEQRDSYGLTEQEFLAQYKQKDYPRPSFTVDMAVFSRDEGGRLQMLMVRRGGHPFLGCWALPGGFVNQDEDADAAAKRELFEETGVSGIEAEQLGVYSAPGRDPRGWTVSAAYIASMDESLTATAGDDAAEAVWCRLESQTREDGTYELQVHTNRETLRLTFEVSAAHFMPPRARVLDSSGFAFDHARITADALLALPEMAWSSSSASS